MTEMKKKGEFLINTLAISIGWHGDVNLLREALTHPTFFEGQKKPEDKDNQRLEFLGDAVVDMLVGEELYHRFPLWQEGEMTKVRASLVCEDSLAELGRNLQINQHILMGKGALRSGDNERNSTIADALEAIIGAMYLTQGIEVVRNFLQTIMMEMYAELEAGKNRCSDFKGELQQYIQKSGNLHSVTYRLLETTGPDHNREFTIGVYINKKQVATGIGHSKKEAEQAGAKLALEGTDLIDKIISGEK